MADKPAVEYQPGLDTGGGTASSVFMLTTGAATGANSFSPRLTAICKILARIHISPRLVTIVLINYCT